MNKGTFLLRTYLLGKHNSEFILANNNKKKNFTRRKFVALLQILVGTIYTNKY